ncbi:MAG: EamA family transporter [Rhodomicrobium sp.]|nr:EamA family transporter [Rhodomicrobium sp.]
MPGTSAVTARATLTGLLAIPVWSLLPALTVVAGSIPPLELVALTFTLGALAGQAFLTMSAGARKDLRRAGLKPVALGIAGLFGYHFAYFLALQNAPAVEASLVNYLWPVLIVVFSAALPKRAGAGTLTPWHLAGVAIAFAGAVLAISGGKALSLGGNAFGYGMALLAALIWSTYSVATRLFRNVPSAAVAIYCLGTALLAWAAHAALEDFVWPAAGAQAAAIVALGLGPLGVAFYVWDYGCKHGDLRLLGVSAYFAPVFSTALLTFTGLAPAKPALWLAALLITGGALLTSVQFWRIRRAAPTS